MLRSKVSKHPGESILVANLTFKNTWSRDCAHWNAGVIFWTPLERVCIWAPSMALKTAFYCFLTVSTALRTWLSASIKSGKSSYWLVSWAPMRSTLEWDVCLSRSSSSSSMCSGIWISSQSYPLLFIYSDFSAPHELCFYFFQSFLVALSAHMNTFTWKFSCFAHCEQSHQKHYFRAFQKLRLHFIIYN